MSGYVRLGHSISG